MDDGLIGPWSCHYIDAKSGHDAKDYQIQDCESSMGIEKETWPYCPLPFTIGTSLESIQLRVTVMKELRVTSNNAVNKQDRL